MRLCKEVPISNAYQQAGKAPISVRWIDINKGDKESPNYRSRLVAREINTSKRNDLFAATPSLEALQVVLSLVTSGNKGEVVMINDVSRAFFHAPAKRKVYVQLPIEDSEKGQEYLCGKLNFSMYGTRDAAQNWFDAYSQQFVHIGFQQKVASPCTFHHQQRSIRTYSHGDDYVSTGKPRDLKWLKNQFESKCQLTIQVLGPEENQLQQVKILNRIITWDNDRGIGYEADPRHVGIPAQQLSLENAKPVITRGAKEEGRTTADIEDPLVEVQSTTYRALVARCNYPSSDRPDIAFAVKDKARHMSAPRTGDWVRLKRLGRYLVGKPRMQQRFEWQHAPTTVCTYVDVGWAGCRESRTSTTCDVIMLGKHSVKSWSKTQALIALSSGEPELYATLKASAETLGTVPMINDYGVRVTAEVWGDAQTALGIIHRK